MARTASEHPTDRELEILRVIWARGNASLSEICADLRLERQIATTTVATVLNVMLEKGLAKRKKIASRTLWTASVTHSKAAQGMVGKLIDGVFEGSASRLASHLIEGGRLSEKELVALRDLINAHAGKSKTQGQSQSK